MGLNFSKAENIELLNQVGVLLDKCRQCPLNCVGDVKREERVQSCGGCPSFTELRSVGDLLWGEDIPRKAKELLRKERHMVTKEDLEYLFENKVSKHRIANAYGYSKAGNTGFKGFVERLGAVEPLRGN